MQQGAVQKQKRKAVLDSNKKPGEKRQNKYYWAKIDAPKPRTPKPRTPKAVTLKPRTPKAITPKLKRKSDVKKVVASKTTVESNPKRVLDFKNCTVTDLGLDLNLSSSGQIDGEGKVIQEACGLFGQVSEEILEGLTCRQCTDLVDSKIAIRDINHDGKIAIRDINHERTSRQNGLKVYRRHNSRCLYQCRKLGPNFTRSCKKKRSLRIKKSIEALKTFEEFNYTIILEGFLDRIFIMKGQSRMLLPRVKFAPESFNCILSLLCSPIIWTKKKRSKRRSGRTNHVTKQSTLQDPISIELSKSSTLTREHCKDENDEPERHVNLAEHVEEHSKDFVPQPEQSEIRLSAQPQLGSIHQGSKAKVTKEKKAGKGNTKVTKEKKLRRTYKCKGKHEDYLRQHTDWRDLEPIMDPFLQHFGSLRIWTDPKAWSIVVSAPHHDGIEDTDNEKAKLEEERSDLLQKIERFLNCTKFFQGEKKFVKWNGSVLDSVVGVFLTQNVSDVLSSNAFMNLASRYPVKPLNDKNEVLHEDVEIYCSSQGSSETACSAKNIIIEHPDEEETTSINEEAESSKEYGAALSDMLASLPFLQEKKGKGKQVEGAQEVDWEAIRVMFSKDSHQRDPGTRDSVDWEAARKASVSDIAKAIMHRGQHNVIASKIQRTLDRVVEKHGSLDLEWLREAPPQVAKAYLLSFHGLGLKSVECLRLLTLRHHGFPVDVNIGRIAIRLGWVPIKPLPAELPFHLLKKYPLENEIQQYLWPRLCHLTQEELYELHYQMITFGKVFCRKGKPNCAACPLKNECKYYASEQNSKIPALAWTQDRRLLVKVKNSSRKNKNVRNPFDIKRISSSSMSRPLTSNLITYNKLHLSYVRSCSQLSTTFNTIPQKPEFIVEHPPSPQPEEKEPNLPDIEDLANDVVDETHDGFIFFKLNTEEIRQTYQDSFEDINMPPQNDYSSRALVTVSPETASRPVRKHMHVSRLRTEHQVYVLSENNVLLKYLHLDPQEGAIPYLLAIWTPDQIKETADTLEGCPGYTEEACSSPNGLDDSSTVPGTLLIPARTAMRGFFPLNGTYFQINEVFADEETSRRPINVPRSWIGLEDKRTLYCGSSTNAIVRGSTEREIKDCCCEGFICVRGFDRKTRAPTPLPSRFHDRSKVKGKLPQDDEDED